MLCMAISMYRAVIGPRKQNATPHSTSCREQSQSQSMQQMRNALQQNGPDQPALGSPHVGGCRAVQGRAGPRARCNEEQEKEV